MQEISLAIIIQHKQWYTIFIFRTKSLTFKSFIKVTSYIKLNVNNSQKRYISLYTTKLQYEHFTPAF